MLLVLKYKYDYTKLTSLVTASFHAHHGCITYTTPISGTKVDKIVETVSISTISSVHGILTTNRNNELQFIIESMALDRKIYH